MAQTVCSLVSAEDRARLTAIAADRNRAQKHAVRARILLHSAEHRDGALGFWKALHEIWPTTRQQRCWVQKTANVLNALPKSVQGKHPAETAVMGVDLVRAIRRRWPWVALPGASSRAGARAGG
jgi:hypothetical protein